MEDGGEAEPAAEFGPGDVLEGGRWHFTQQQIVEDLGVLLAQRPEGLRDGEGDQEVRHARQETGFLGGAPALLVERPAHRAVAVVATMVAVTQGVAGDGPPPSLGLPAQGEHDGFEGVLHRGGADVAPGAVHGLGQAAALRVPALPHSGKEPLRIAVRPVVAAQPHQELLADGHLPALAALAVDHPQHAALAVDVAGLQMGALAQAQPAVVHHGEQGPEPPLPDRAQQGGHPFDRLRTGFLPADDVGKQFLAMELDGLPALPLAAQVVAVEGPQRAQGLVDGGVLQLLLHLQVQQEVPHLGLAEAPDRLALVVLRQAPHPRQVSLAGARLQISKLDKGTEFLVPRLRGDAVVC